MCIHAESARPRAPHADAIHAAKAYALDDTGAAMTEIVAVGVHVGPTICPVDLPTQALSKRFHPVCVRTRDVERSNSAVVVGFLEREGRICRLGRA